MSDKKANLSIEGVGDIELPIYSGSIGPDVVDVGGLVAKGLFTYDSGFVSTAACESQITYIDGGKGILLHGGYPIDQLAEHSDFLETCYLLLNGELPKADAKSEFEQQIAAEMAVDPVVGNTYKGFAKDAHPMAMLAAATSSLAAVHHGELDILSEEYRINSAKRLIAKSITLAGMGYKHSQGEEFVAPRSDLSYSENFLNMTFGNNDGSYEISPVLAKAMDKIFILHADHEQNASTSTVRLSGSTNNSPYAAVTAGITALWGPSHGGANEAVLTMLEEIGDVSKIDEFVDRAKDKDDPFRLMGFGHRVYKNFDPRAKVMKQTADEVLSELGLENDPLLAIAKRLEQIALEDEYFIEKKLYPNVDFYSGIILKAMGIPTSMFTVIFALGRMPGWIAHWHEMLSNPYKIGRPRQLYTGPTQRDFTPLEDR